MTTKAKAKPKRDEQLSKGAPGDQRPGRSELASFLKSKGLAPGDIRIACGLARMSLDNDFFDMMEKAARTAAR